MKCKALPLHRSLIINSANGFGFNRLLPGDRKFYISGSWEFNEILTKPEFSRIEFKIRDSVKDYYIEIGSEVDTITSYYSKDQIISVDYSFITSKWKSNTKRRYHFGATPIEVTEVFYKWLLDNSIPYEIVGKWEFNERLTIPEWGTEYLQYKGYSYTNNKIYDFTSMYLSSSDNIKITNNLYVSGTGLAGDTVSSDNMIIFFYLFESNKDNIKFWHLREDKRFFEFKDTTSNWLTKPFAKWLIQNAKIIK